MPFSPTPDWMQPLLPQAPTQTPPLSANDLLAKLIQGGRSNNLLSGNFLAGPFGSNPFGNPFAQQPDVYTQISKYLGNSGYQPLGGNIQSFLTPRDDTAPAPRTNQEGS